MQTDGFLAQGNVLLVSHDVVSVGTEQKNLTHSRVCRAYMHTATHSAVVYDGRHNGGAVCVACETVHCVPCMQCFA